MAVPVCRFSMRPLSCKSTAMTKARGRDVPSRTLVGPGSVGDAVTLVKDVAAVEGYAVVDKKGTAVLVD